MIRIRNIKVSLTGDLKSEISKLLRLNDFDYSIVKRSIDARKKQVSLIYTVDVNCELKDVKRLNDSISETPIEKYEFKVTGNIKQNKRPIIVGACPSGLFISYSFNMGPPSNCDLS